MSAPHSESGFRNDKISCSPTSISLITPAPFITPPFPYLAALMFSAFCIPLSADADTQIPVGTKSAELMLSMLNLNDRTSFRWLCRLAGRQDCAAADGLRQFVAA